MPIIANQLAGKVVISVANNGAIAETVTLANMQLTGETVTGFTIAQIFWSTNNTIQVQRGANNVAVLHGSGFWDLAGSGDSLTRDATATNVVITITGSGSIVLECSKDVTFQSTY